MGIDKARLRERVSAVVKELDGWRDEVDRTDESEAWIGDYLAYAIQHLRSIVEEA